MPNNKPSYLLLLLAICRAISYFPAGIQYLIIKSGVVKPPVYILKLTDNMLKTLHCVWHARLVRRTISLLVRTPLRRNILKLINFNINIPAYRGCIIAICHTPWKRLLTQWCLEKKFALIVGGVKWNDRRRLIQRKGAGVIELRELVKYIEVGGRIIVIADVFNKLTNCPVKFRGNDCNAFVFAERLARLTKVPILTVIPKLSDTAIEFTTGPQFRPDGLKFKSFAITTEIISFFDKEIEDNPSIFSDYVK